MNNDTPLHSEADRLALLTATRLLDADPPPALQALVRMAVAQTHASTALINLVDAHRVFALARHGSTRRHLSREGSWCDQVVQNRHPLLIRDVDTAKPPAPDARDGQNEPVWRSYAGVPILVDGMALGTVCVFDTHAQAFDDTTTAALADVASVAADIITAQLASHRARLLEARIRTASLSSSDWLWETDDQGHIQWVSASLLQHTGLDPIAEIGLYARDIYHPRKDDTAASWDRYVKAKARREPFADAIAERDTPRGRIAVSISGTPVFNSMGHFMGYRGSSRNVTRQLELESQARYHDHLLRQAVETFQAGVMITDPQGRIIQANRHWRERLGIADLNSAPSWPELVRQLIKEGHYGAITAGREEDFFQWRMGIVDQTDSVALRTNDVLLMCRDHRLPDGSIVHFSTEVSASERDAVTLQAVLQADLSLGLLVVKATEGSFPVVYANAGVAHMAGTLKDNLPGRPCLDVLAALGATHQVQASLRGALAQGQSWVAVLGQTPTPQQPHPHAFEMRLTPLISPEGHVQHFMVLLHDVTDRQTAAEKLRVSEELYRCVAATISDGLLVVGLDGKLVAMNPAGNRILGLGKDQVQALFGAALDIGLLKEDLSGPLPLEDVPWLRTARTGQRLRNQVYPLRTHEDELVWIQLSCHQLAIASETSPFAVVTTFRDITQERAAAQALARSEERWKFALEGAGDAVWDWAVGHGMVFYSKRWREMLGYIEDHESEPVQWLDRIHDDERDQIAQAFDDYCHEGQGIFQTEFRIRHKQGHYIWILCRGKVVRRDSDGLPLRVVGTHSDISLIKQAEDAMREKRSAELANQAKTEFLSRMSHEIRTPLNAVRGFAQLLDHHLKPDTSSDARSYVGHILHSSELLSDLVSDVLDLQQIEAGAMHLHCERFDIGEVLQPCLAMFEPQASKLGIALHVDLQHTCTAWADKRRLAQVISNLVSNAIKYNRSGGSVTVSTTDLASGRWQLSVQDTGPGMSPEQMSKLFQPFERLGKDTSSIEGTGLGLIITKSLVEAMGGCLDINSLIGEGSRLTVTLNQSSPDQEATLAPSANGVESISPPDPAHTTEVAANDQRACTETTPLRVMYVEDNRINAMLFQEALRPFPELQLEVAEDGQDAMTLAQSHRPEVLVIDAHLPGMTGFEVLSALRTLPGIDGIPAYMCSADALPEDIAKARQAGFAGYWTKPIDIQQVTEALCKIAREGR